MPGSKSRTLSHPLFSEPTFNEETKTVDPAGFLAPHPGDKELYKEVSSLLSKQVATFEKSRIPDSEFMSLEKVYGEHGNAVINQINNAGKIIFHVLGSLGGW